MKVGTFIPNTKEEQLEMLREIGYKDFDDLFGHVPEKAKFKGALDIPKGKPEAEVFDIMKEMSEKNRIFKKIFRGAGAYNHYVPAAVDAISGKEEFLTAYTPYQAEISQGILQSIFEFQTMICELTGMDVANASMYDGASAAAEGCAMTADRKRSTIYVSETTDPRVLSVIKTYSFGRDTEVKCVPEKDGETDKEALAKMLGEDPEAACFLFSYPNFYGIVEDADAIAKTVHDAGAQLVMYFDPIALGILKTPGEIGADAAVGEGQSLGMGLSFGGPYLGLLTTTQKNMRKIVGRVVGETVDTNGERGYVLTLQAREQHIRREKAASNICTSQALCALRAGVYMATVGPAGIEKLALSCSSNAHYLADGLAKAGLKLRYDKPFFNEFVTDSAKENELLAALEKKDILGGLPLKDGGILWCATEMNSKEDIGEVVAAVKEVIGA